MKQNKGSTIIPCLKASNECCILNECSLFAQCFPEAYTKYQRGLEFTNCSNCGILQSRNNEVCFKCGGKVDNVFDLDKT